MSKQRIKNAIVWRESVFKNDFKCSCGKVLFENDQIPDDMLYDTFDDLLVCPVCRKTVAKLMTEEDAMRIGAFREEKA